MRPLQLLVLSLLPTSLVIAATVTVRSGNGTIGGRDGLISFLAGPVSVDFGTLTPTDLSNAQNGPAAYIISPNSAWIPSLNEPAQWIGTNTNAAYSGNTALYAISFTIPNSFTSGSIG